MLEPNAIERLHSDQRGAILVVGIAMGLLMVGALWNIVSVGDAILWRERLQDAADAAAFENAVWNARGMNVLVFLNIVLSGAMAILVAVRGVIIFLQALAAALTAATLGCFFPVTPITAFLCGISSFAPTVRSAQTSVEEFEQSIKPPIQAFMRGVMVAEQVVATAVPLLGVKESGDRTSSEYNMPAVALSPSLLPVIIDRAITVRIPGVDPDQRLGRFTSLPVSEDSAGKLCEKAGRFVPNELLVVLGNAGIPDWLLNGAGGFFRDLAGTIAGSMPAIFCGDQSPRDITQLGDLFQQQANENCNGARQRGRVTPDSDHTRQDRENLRQYQDYWQPGLIAGSDGSVERGYVFDTARCQREQLQQVSSDYRPDTSFKPARVWTYTKNGDFVLQSWGVAWSIPNALARNDRGISFPVSGQPALPDADVYQMGMAQAELYWATGEGSGCDGTWPDCKAEAMWMMRWKARLRRLHNPADMALHSIANIAVSQFINAVQSGLGELSQRGFAAFGNWARGTRWETFSNFMRGDLWSGAYRYRQFDFDPIRWAGQQTVGSWLATNPPPSDKLIIH